MVLGRLARTRGIAALGSAILTVTIVLAGLAIRSTAPFGPRGRSINDLGDQFVPFHAHLWDLLRGTTVSGWQWTWESALGVPFVPDLATYLTNPVALTVALWPRDQMETAVLTVTVVTYAASAAAMVTYLRRLRPEGSAVVAALLGTAWATCGWALDDGSYVPMWLTGLVGLPLIALVGEWARDRSHPVLAPFIVALVWIANFYTAYMATLGAGLLVLARVLTSGSSWRDSARTLLVAARHVLLGMAMSAVVLVPTYLAVRRAQPTPMADPTAAPWRDALARLLPLTEGVGLTPGLFVGTTTVLLALTLVFNAHVPTRERLMWSALTGLTLASLQWGPTQGAWHLFQPPNGSGYRQAFVVCAMLVVLAWISVTAGLRVRTIAAGAACAALLVAVVTEAPGTTQWSTPLAMLTLAVSVTWLVLRPRARLAGRWAAAALVGVLAVESVATWVVLDERREERLGAAAPAWGPANSELLRTVHGSVTGASRGGLTEVLPPIPDNAPMLYGYPGVRYYSSTIPETTSHALRALGLPWSGGGRAIRYRPDPGLDPLLAMSRVLRPDGTRSHGAAGPGVAGLVLPMDSPAWRVDPWSARNAVVGARVYTVPLVTVLIDGKRRPLPEAGVRQRITPGASIGLEFACTPGRIVQFWAPDQTGELRTPDGRTALLPSARGDAGSREAQGVLTIEGPEPNGVIELRTDQLLALPGRPVGCLDEARLRSTLAENVSRIERGPDSLRLTWPTPQTGKALLSPTAVPGWRCTGSDGSARELGAVAGMLAAETHADRSLVCRYRTPGLRPGASLSALAAIIVVGLAGWQARRARRDPAPPSAPADDPPTARA